MRVTWIRLGAAGVVFLVPLGRNAQDVPLYARVVLTQVDPHFHFVFPVFLIDML